ncbi:hypothetical protein [Helicobacter didelphidarum]|nr:hypothetical protein [Helicobacter didelphidarum]
MSEIYPYNLIIFSLISNVNKSVLYLQLYFYKKCSHFTLKLNKNSVKKEQ